MRRLSVGSALARIAYGALYESARELLETGGLTQGAAYLDRDVAGRAFAARGLTVIGT